jgi:Domain of unknown function (DUF4184)
MPFTFAHPAAILPLRRFSFFQTVPLIIGSLSPDVPYFLPGRLAYLFETHTFEGSFICDLPVGLALLALTLLLREPLTALLSARARWVCMQSIQRFHDQPWHWPIAVLSLLVGSWTHIAWDSFTHPAGWTAMRVAALNAPISLLGWDTEVSHLLQYLSSLFGLAVLAVWLHRLVANAPDQADGEPLRSRAHWFLLTMISAAALVIGGARGLLLWHMGSWYHLAFLLLTRVIGWFGFLYLAGGMAILINRRMVPEPAN